MVLRWYLILLAIGFIGMIIIHITEKEEKERGKFSSRQHLKFLGKLPDLLNVLEEIYIVIMMVIYPIFMIVYCIIAHHFFFMGIPILELLMVIFYIMNIKIKSFNFVTEFFAGFFWVIWAVYTFLFCIANIDTPLGEEKITQNKEITQTIDIVEFTQVPYNNITGRRYYIKSATENAYYYEVRTEKGGTTTKSIDGSKYYVEKFISNKYINNPHIDIEKLTTISEYTNWYGNNVTEENVEYKYYIYIPEDATFYEQ